MNDFYLLNHILSFLSPSSNDQASSSTSYPFYVFKLTFRCLLSIPTNTYGSQFAYSVSLLKWAISNAATTIISPRIFAKCVGYASIEVLEWFLLRGKLLLSVYAPVEAIKARRLDIIKWLRSKECPWDEKTSAAATLLPDGKEILMWLRDQNDICPWKSDTCQNAALVGNLSLLQWLREQNPPCAWSSGTFSNAAYAGHLHILNWAVSRPDRPHDWNSKIFKSAARGGQIDVLKWALLHNCPYDSSSFDGAAINGHENVFLWAYSSNRVYRFDEETVIYAAFGGHLNLLQHLAKIVPPKYFSISVSRAATAGGHLHVLQWLRSQNPPCPWNEEIYLIAKANQFTNIVEWLQTFPHPLR